MPKGKNKRKPKHNKNDFYLPEMDTDTKGNRTQEVAEVTDFYSVQNIICVCCLSGEYISCRLPGRLRKGKNKGGPMTIEAGCHVFISRRDYGTSNYKGKKIYRGDIITKYSEDQWNNIKYNPDYVTQKHCLKKQDEEDDATFDFVVDDI
jgi:hypothetical protein